MLPMGVRHCMPRKGEGSAGCTAPAWHPGAAQVRLQAVVGFLAEVMSLICMSLLHHACFCACTSRCVTIDVQVATACAATVKAVSARQARLSGEVGKAQQAASLADAKCAALGAELAQLWRDSGWRRPPSEALARRLQRIPKPCCARVT